MFSEKKKKWEREGEGEGEGESILLICHSTVGRNTVASSGKFHFSKFFQMWTWWSKCLQQL